MLTVHVTLTDVEPLAEKAGVGVIHAVLLTELHTENEVDTVAL